MWLTQHLIYPFWLQVDPVILIGTPTMPGMGSLTMGTVPSHNQTKNAVACVMADQVCLIMGKVLLIAHTCCTILY